MLGFALEKNDSPIAQTRREKSDETERVRCRELLGWARGLQDPASQFQRQLEISHPNGMFSQLHRHILMTREETHSPLTPCQGQGTPAIAVLGATGRGPCGLPGPLLHTSSRLSAATAEAPASRAPPSFRTPLAQHPCCCLKPLHSPPAPHTCQQGHTGQGSKRLGPRGEQAVLRGCLARSPLSSSAPRDQRENRDTSLCQRLRGN